jgi:hypothetical protein
MGSIIEDKKTGPLGQVKYRGFAVFLLVVKTAIVFVSWGGFLGPKPCPLGMEIYLKKDLNIWIRVGSKITQVFPY